MQVVRRGLLSKKKKKEKVVRHGYGTGNFVILL